MYLSLLQTMRQDISPKAQWTRVGGGRLVAREVVHLDDSGKRIHGTFHGYVTSIFHYNNAYSLMKSNL